MLVASAWATLGQGWFTSGGDGLLLGAVGYFGVWQRGLGPRAVGYFGVDYFGRVTSIKD